MADSGSKKLAIGGGLIVILAAVGYFVMGGGDSTPQTPTTPQTPSASNRNNSKTVEVEPVASRGPRKGSSSSRERLAANEDNQDADDDMAADEPQAKKRRGGQRNKASGRRTESHDEVDDFRDAKPTRGMVPGPG